MIALLNHNSTTQVYSPLAFTPPCRAVIQMKQRGKVISDFLSGSGHDDLQRGFFCDDCVPAEESMIVDCSDMSFQRKWGKTALFCSNRFLVGIILRLFS